MIRTSLRVCILGILLVSLAALPSMAQPVPASNDYFRTPANGQTFFEFPDGDVESLCGAPPQAAWNHRVALTGVPQAGSDWDTVVSRLDSLVFPPFNGVAQTLTTRVQVRSLTFVSIASQLTPCGELNWTARLAGAQPITKMVITRSTQGGGTFTANLAVSVELSATDTKGNYVGSLFYTRDLPNPTTGTPWSWRVDGVFRAGISDTNNCIAVLRAKLNTVDPASSHYYWISDMIAQGVCTRPN